MSYYANVFSDNDGFPAENGGNPPNSVEYESEFEDATEDEDAEYAENLLSDYDEFEDATEDEDAEYAENLLSDYDEFEDATEGEATEYAENLLSDYDEFEDATEDAATEYVENHLSDYDEFEDATEDGATEYLENFFLSFAVPEKNAAENKISNLPFEGDVAEEPVNAMAVNLEMKEKTSNQNVVQKNSKEKKSVELGKIAMQHIEAAFLERVPIRLVRGNLFYYDSCSYRKADPIKVQMLLRSALPKEIVNNLKGMFQYREVVEYLRINPKLLMDDRKFPYSKERNYIAFRNIVVDAKTLKCFKHSPKFPLFFSLDADYQEQPEATPEFDVFLESVSNGDMMIKELILEVLGYLFLHSNDAKKFFVFAPAPDSGKSVLLAFINMLFPEDCIMHTPLREMGDKFAMTDLPYIAINTYADLSAGKVSEDSVGMVKSLTGDSVLSYQAKFKDPKNATHHMHLVFATNTPISLKKQDEAFWNRMVIVPFNYTTPKSEQRRDLLEVLLQERDAIASKAVQAVSKVIERNYQFTLPEESKKMWLEWSGNVEMSFQIIMNALIEVTNDEMDRLSAEELYKIYQKVASEQGISVVTYNSFLKHVVDVYDIKKGKLRVKGRENPVSCFVGVKRKSTLLN